jgi:hypothetical protein
MFELVALEYTTVREYVRYCDDYPTLVTGKADLKDAQRPWVLEAVKRYVPGGGKVLDLGGSRCELAGAMAADYDIAVIDPYDGRDGGPASADLYRKRHPDVTIIEGLLGPDSDLPKQEAVVSTSVIEHIPPSGHDELVRAISDVLKPGGVSIHAVDLTCRAVDGFLESQQALCQSWVDAHGVEADISALVDRMVADVETFWLPVTMYQQWRKERPFDDYPWRHVGTMNLIARKVG